MKKLSVFLFCCFFLISGRILYSIGTDSILRGGAFTDIEAPTPPAPVEKKKEAAAPDPASPPENDGWGRNPFRSLECDNSGTAPVKAAKKEVKDVPLKLEGISLGAGKTLAVINGSVFAPGDIVEGYRVQKITLDGVILEKDGTLSELKFKEEWR